MHRVIIQEDLCITQKGDLMEIIKNACSVEAGLKVKTYDIDVAGHLNNIAYVKWLEDLRTILLEKNFHFSEIIYQGFYPVVTSTSIKYKRQIRLFDHPVGKMTLIGINHGIFALKAELTVDENLCASAEQMFVIMKLCDSKFLNTNDIIRFIKS